MFYSSYNYELCNTIANELNKRYKGDNIDDVIYKIHDDINHIGIMSELCEYIKTYLYIETEEEQNLIEQFCFESIFDTDIDLLSDYDDNEKYYIEMKQYDNGQVVFSIYEKIMVITDITINTMYLCNIMN